MITMEKVQQDATCKQEDTNGSNPALTAAQSQAKMSPSTDSLGNPLLPSISDDNITPFDSDGSTDTKEVLLSVEDLKLNKWETLMISIPDKKEENRTVLLNMRGKKHKIRVVHFEAHPDTRLGRLLKATDIKEILKLCDDFFQGSLRNTFLTGKLSPFSQASPMTQDKCNSFCIHKILNFPRHQEQFLLQRHPGYLSHRHASPKHRHVCSSSSG